MAISHVFSNALADVTGTITGFNSQGSTTTIAATNLVRPSNWNSAHNQFYTLSGNTANASTASGTNVVFQAAGGLTLAGSTGTIVISAPNVPNRSYIEIMQGERMTTNWVLSESAMSNRLLLLPFWLDGAGLVPNTVRFMVTGIASSNRSLVGTFRAGLYSAANSTQLSLLVSDSQTISITDSSNSSVWNGYRALDFTRMSGSTMTNEGRWVVALAVSMASNNTAFANVGVYGGDNMPAFSGYLLGGTSTGATNASSHIVPFFGCYSATTSGLPSTIGLTEIGGNNSASMRDLYVVIKQI